MPLFLAATPSPYPTGVSVTQSTGGSPGFLGFVFTFALALAAVLLFLSLTKQMRRVDRRAKQRDLEEQEAAAEGQVPSARPAPDEEGPTTP